MHQICPGMHSIYDSTEELDDGFEVDAQKWEFKMADL
jgi:hypothetical protein